MLLYKRSLNLPKDLKTTCFPLVTISSTLIVPHNHSALQPNEMYWMSSNIQHSFLFLFEDSCLFVCWVLWSFLWFISVYFIFHIWLLLSWCGTACLGLLIFSFFPINLGGTRTSFSRFPINFFNCAVILFSNFFFVLNVIILKASSFPDVVSSVFPLRIKYNSSDYSSAPWRVNIIFFPFISPHLLSSVILVRFFPPKKVFWWSFCVIL